jgi:hypothetical protein
MIIPKWKRLMSLGRETGKILHFNKYITAYVSWSCMTSKDKENPYKGYINSQLVAECKTEEEAMKLIEKELEELPQQKVVEK